MNIRGVVIHPSPIAIPDNVLWFPSVSKAPRLYGVMVVYAGSTEIDPVEDVLDYINQTSPRKLYYIKDSISADDKVKFYIRGKSGTYIDDEDYLTDPDMLEELLYEEVSTDLDPVSSLDLIEDFNARVKSGEEIPVPYLNMVADNTKDLVRIAKESEELADRASKVSADIFDSIQVRLTDSQRSLDKEYKKVEELEAIVESYKSNRHKSSMALLYNYPQVNYPVNDKCIAIKGLGTTPYLVTFCLALRKYISQKKRSRAKLIVVLPLGESNQKHYSTVKDSSFITLGNYSNAALAQSDVIFTNYPINTVLTRIFRTKYNTAVVLDLLTTSPEHIVSNTSGIVDYWWCIGSSRYLDQMPSGSLYFSTPGTVEGAKFSLKPIEDYSSRAVKQYQQYQAAFSQGFDMLLSGGES